MILIGVLMLTGLLAAKTFRLLHEVQRLRASAQLRPVLIVPRERKFAVTCPHCGAYVEE